MFAFFRCVAEAVVAKGVRGLIAIVPGGAFACEVADAAWKKYRERKNAGEIREEIQELARASFEEARRAAADAVEETSPPGATAEDRLNLELFLSQIPGAVRTSLKRPEDVTGCSVPPAFALSTPGDVLKLLPGRPPRFKPNAPLPGLVGWALLEPLGSGGFGEVWLARHGSMTSLCGAVKFCHGDQARELKHESALVNRVMAAGGHPNIVPLTNAYLEGDAPWLMYEFVPGGDLADRIRAWQAVPPPDRVARATAALRELAEAVGFFHKLTPPVVHRDLKPSNVLFDPATGKLRITDFGIGGVMAKAALAEETRGAMTSAGRLASYLRGSHTPLYSSPQQREGADADPRDDVHALGVIGYQMLTGYLSQGTGPDFAEDLRDARVPEDLIALLGRCVAQKPDRRYRDAAELAARLGAATADATTREKVAAGERQARELAEEQTQSANLARWEVAGEPARWVASRNGQWDDAQWRGLLGELQRSGYWPLDPNAVGTVLEREKAAFLARQRLEAGRAKSEAEQRTREEEARLAREEEARRAAAEAERRRLEEAQRAAPPWSVPAGPVVGGGPGEVAVNGHSGWVYTWPAAPVLLAVGAVQAVGSGLTITALVPLTLGAACFLLWLGAVFLARPVRLIVTPGQVRVVREWEMAYDATGMTFEMRREGAPIYVLVVNYLLGLGTADIVLTSGGARPDEIRIPNVASPRRKMREIEAVLRNRSH